MKCHPNDKIPLNMLPSGYFATLENFKTKIPFACEERGRKGTALLANDGGRRRWREGGGRRWLVEEDGGAIGMASRARSLPPPAPPAHGRAAPPSSSPVVVRPCALTTRRRWARSHGCRPAWPSPALPSSFFLFLPNQGYFSIKIP